MPSAALKDQIQQQIKEAMRAHEKDRITALRSLMAAIKQKEVDERIELDDQQVLSVIQKLIKQRKEAIEQYQAAQREDLLNKEKAELELLQTFLPPQLNETELNTLVDQAIAESGAQSLKDMGKVMGILKPKVQDRADMSDVSQKVKTKLAQKTS